MSFGPFLYAIGLSPGIHLIDNPLNQVLLLSRLDKNGVTLIIEPGQDLFEFIDGIMLDRMAQILEGLNDAAYTMAATYFKVSPGIIRCHQVKI